MVYFSPLLRGWLIFQDPSATERARSLAVKGVAAMKELYGKEYKVCVRWSSNQCC